MFDGDELRVRWNELRDLVKRNWTPREDDLRRVDERFERLAVLVQRQTSEARDGVERILSEIVWTRPSRPNDAARKLDSVGRDRPETTE